MDLQLPAPAASFILCIFLSAQCPVAESVCEANGKTYNAGETWQNTDQQPECFQHICLQDGTYTISKCDPVHNDTEETSEETTMAYDVNFEKVLPTDEDATQINGCTVLNRVVQVGEQVNFPGSCGYMECYDNDLWVGKGCAQLVLPSDKMRTPVDVSQPYPECCGKVVASQNVIPDVVQGLQHPTAAMRLTYGNNTVDYGNELIPAQVKAEPAVDYSAERNSLFLLAMVDADTSSRQNATFTEFLHWMVGNIEGNKISSGKVLAEYIGPDPPQGSGPHRYVFLLFKQPGKINFEDPLLNKANFEGRKRFSTNKFALKNNLGNPISINFFVTK